MRKTIKMKMVLNLKQLKERLDGWDFEDMSEEKIAHLREIIRENVARHDELKELV